MIDLTGAPVACILAKTANQDYITVSKGLPRETKAALVAEYRTHETDSGSPEVQIAVLSKRIEELTGHAQRNKNDHHNRLGLLKLVQKRRRLLKYLEREDFERYKALRDKLGLRR
jgi:small subunit ribosomal protein S15